VPRYQVTGIPPDVAARGLSAFMPHFTRLAAGGAQAYKGQVTGRPGTAAIPMYPGNSVPSPDEGDRAQMGTSRSSDAPNAFWPNQYWTQPDPLNDTSGGTAKVEVYTPTRPQDTTMIPVPATDLRSLHQARAANLAGGIDTDRDRPLRQAVNFIRWPGRRSGNGSDQ